MIKALSELYRIEKISLRKPFGRSPERLPPSTSPYLYAPLLSIAIKNTLDASGLDQILNLLISGNLLRFPRHLLSRTYLRQLYRFLFFKEIFSTHQLVISSEKIALPDLIIKARFGLKLFNLEKHSVTTVSISSKDNHLFDRELRIRKKYHHFSIINPILRSGKTPGGFTFFTEPVLSSGPPFINQKGHLVDDTIKNIFKSLVPLYKANLKKVNQQEYVTQLMEGFKNYLTQEEQNVILNKSSPGKPLYLTLTHGDLVGANVMQADKIIKLIDWGYAGLRTLTYDAYTILYNLTSTKGIHFNINKIISASQGLTTLTFLSPITKIFKEESISLFNYWLIFYLERAKMWQGLGEKKHSRNIINQLKKLVTFLKK